MGFDVYITRAELPEQSGQHPISELEWKGLVESDSSLTISPDEHCDRRTSDGRIERFQMVVWTAHPGRPPFMLIDGAVRIKSPDEATLQKMVEMAKRLGARVMGESGEVYPETTEEVRPVQPAGSARWPLWKQVLLAFLLGCILLALKLLIFGK